MPSNHGGGAHLNGSKPHHAPEPTLPLLGARRPVPSTEDRGYASPPGLSTHLSSAPRPLPRGTRLWSNKTPR